MSPWSSASAGPNVLVLVSDILKHGGPEQKFEVDQGSVIVFIIPGLRRLGAGRCRQTQRDPISKGRKGRREGGKGRGGWTAGAPPNLCGTLLMVPVIPVPLPH